MNQQITKHARMTWLSLIVSKLSFEFQKRKFVESKTNFIVSDITRTKWSVDNLALNNEEIGDEYWGKKKTTHIKTSPIQIWYGKTWLVLYFLTNSPLCKKSNRDKAIICQTKKPYFYPGMIRRKIYEYFTGILRIRAWLLLSRFALLVVHCLYNNCKNRLAKC